MAASARRSWTPAEDTQLRALHASGLSLSECARRIDRANTRVSEHSKVLGLLWDRSQTKAATEATKADTAARVATNQALRAEQETGFLVDAARLRAQLWAPCKAFNFGGKDNTYEEHALEQPTFVDQLKIMQAATIAVDRSLKIAVHDSDSSHDDAKSMLTGLAAAMGLAFRSPDQVPESGIRND